MTIHCAACDQKVPEYDVVDDVCTECREATRDMNRQPKVVVRQLGRLTASLTTTADIQEYEEALDRERGLQ